MTGTSPEEQLAGVQECLVLGDKIQAIKIYRAWKGTGLAESKTAVEQLEAELRSTCPERFTPPTAGSGCIGATVMICALVATIIISVVAAVFLWFIKP